MRVGSLFSGIGGLDLGFERAGFEIAWQVEIDPWCRKVLTKHWPNVPKYEDVRNVGAKQLEWVDVIVGGFPCQPVSLAGRRKGQEDARWLWPEFARIIAELRPRYAVLENVPGLISRGLADVLSDLTSHGYDAEWQIISAAALGAPHIRERVFIVAYPGSERRQQVAGGSPGHEGPNEGWATQDDYILAGHGKSGGGRILADAYGGNEYRRVGDVQMGRGWRACAFTPNSAPPRVEWEPEPAICRVANGIPNRFHRLRGLGNAVVPQVAQYVAECVKAHAEAY